MEQCSDFSEDEPSMVDLKRSLVRAIAELELAKRDRIEAARDPGGVVAT